MPSFGHKKRGGKMTTKQKLATLPENNTVKLKIYQALEPRMPIALKANNLDIISSNFKSVEGWLLIWLRACTRSSR